MKAMQLMSRLPAVTRALVVTFSGAGRVLNAGKINGPAGLKVSI